MGRGVAESGFALTGPCRGTRWSWGYAPLAEHPPGEYLVPAWGKASSRAMALG